MAIDPEQLAALVKLAEQARQHGVDLLWDRWADLDRRDPVTPFRTQVKLADRTSTREGCWIESRQITAADDGETKWGDVNNRGYTYKLNMDSLAGCVTEDDYEEYLTDLQWAQLVAYPGPLGPLVSTGGDGRHRTGILKALTLAKLWMHNVRTESTLMREGDRGHVWLNTGSGMPPLRSNDDEGMKAYRDNLEYGRRRNTETIQHLHRLELNKVISGLNISGGGLVRTINFTLQRDLPVFWALELPADVAKLSRRYARCYPDFLGSTDGPALCDGISWVHHLAPLEPKAPSTSSGQRVASPASPRPQAISRPRPGHRDTDRSGISVGALLLMAATLVAALLAFLVPR